MSRAQYWIFTLNNYSFQEEIYLRELNDEKVAFLSFGREVGEEGTHHLQGHLELTKRLRLQQVKTLLGCHRFHLEARKGTFEQAQEYVEKDGDVFVYGVRVSKGSGKRTDLDRLHEALVEKRSLIEISNDHFGSFMRYRRSIFSYRNINATQRQWQVSVIIYWGKTGTGKTSSVLGNLASIRDLWISPSSGWFDGYDGQPICLFDDFSGSDFKLPYLLKLLDRYPMQVPIKGGFVSWIPKEIYLTSNLNPKHWFPNAHPEHVLALFRRITNIVKFQ